MEANGDAMASGLRKRSGADDSTSVSKPDSSSAAPKISEYLKATRPWSFICSLGPLALGICLAFKSLGVFSWWICVVTHVCVIFGQAGTNLLNTYVDFTKVSIALKTVSDCSKSVRLLSLSIVQQNIVY